MPRKKADSTGAVKPKKERLTPKEKLYCHLYLQTFSQVRSYQEAFNTDRRQAIASAYTIHKKKRVQEEINRLLDIKLKEIDLRPGSIIQKHLDIAFADINDYVEKNEDGTLKLKDLTQSDGAAVAELQYSAATGAFRIKLNDRQKSLDWLANNLVRNDEEAETGVVVLADVE